MVYIPDVVDGKPFCLNLLAELAQHPKGSSATHDTTLRFDMIPEVKAQFGHLLSPRNRVTGLPTPLYEPLYLYCAFLNVF